MLNNKKEKARKLIKEFKGQNYLFGLDLSNKISDFIAEYKGKALLISNNSQYLKSFMEAIKQSLAENNIEIAGKMIVKGATPNTPSEDVYRIESSILHHNSQFLIAVGSGSTIDAVKAANVLATLGDHNNDIENYFGTNLVDTNLNKANRQLLPFVAVQTAASSAAHLTRYSNVTDFVNSQKKLIVDDQIIPDKAIFDYEITKSASQKLTADGAFDSIAHCLEVFYGASQQNFDKLKEVAGLGIDLIVNNLEKVIEDPQDDEAREALGLGSDLGGYSIMIGGTNGGHLTSFSLVDLTTHGNACAIMNPYYTVFFAPEIEKQLHVLGKILNQAGYIDSSYKNQKGKKLGISIARGMLKICENIGYPVKLNDLPDFNDSYIEKALEAAKNPQLEMKLKSMPVSLNASLVDEYMGPILEAAKTGNFDLIKMLK